MDGWWEDKPEMVEEEKSRGWAIIILRGHWQSARRNATMRSTCGHTWVRLGPACTGIVSPVHPTELVLTWTGGTYRLVRTSQSAWFIDSVLGQGGKASVMLQSTSIRQECKDNGSASFPQNQYWSGELCLCCQIWTLKSQISLIYDINVFSQATLSIIWVQSRSLVGAMHHKDMRLWGWLIED